MKSKVNKLEKDMLEISIELDKQEWDAMLDKAYQANKNKYNVQGFRKGKAPRKAIETSYGSMVFFDDALDIVYKEHYISIVQSKKLYPVSAPSMAIEKLDDTGLKMVLTVQNRPTVELGEYKNIEIKGEKATVDEKEVDKYITTMAERNARKVEVSDRAVQNGDIVDIDFEGSVDGVKFEGGTAQHYELEIGSHSFIEGFEDQIVGMNIGEDRDIKVVFPKEYGAKDLAGKEAVFAIKLHKIMVKEIPAIDDAWASAVSEFDTLDKFKDDVRANLLKQAEERAETANTNALIDAIVKNAKFEVPQCMVEDEIEYIMQDFEQRLMMQGMRMEDYLSYIGKTIEEVKAEQNDIAKANCGIRLVIEEIITKEKIKVTAKDIDKKLTEIAKQYGQKLEDFKKNMPEKYAAQIENEVLMNKLVDFLKENNKIRQ